MERPRYLSVGTLAPPTVGLGRYPCAHRRVLLHRAPGRNKNYPEASGPGGATTTGPDATPPPPSYLSKLGGGGGGGGRG